MDISKNWTDKWDSLFNQEEFVYGEVANEFLKEELLKLNLGSILFPAEGEGRNAVFAAKMGWDVFAFDISQVGRTKALNLAKKNNVVIDYRLGKLDSIEFELEQFDVIALIYAHFPSDVKSMYHNSLDKYLKKGGIVIFEAFSKNHLDYQRDDYRVGGPRDIESLFSKEEIQSDFSNYNIIELKEEVIELQEGLLHNGKGSVIRFIGQKK